MDNNENLKEEIKKELKDEMKKDSLMKKIFSILFLIIVAVGFYFAGRYTANIFIPVDTDSKDDSNTKTNEEEVIDNTEKQVISISESEVTNLISKLSNVDNCRKLDDFVSTSKITTNDISNDLAYLLVERNLYSSSPASISLSDFSIGVAKFLGKNYSFNPNNVNYKSSRCPQYYYDSTTQIFNKQQTACGGTCSSLDNYSILNYSTTTDNVLVNVKVNEINYLFTFTLEDGNYVFTSSEAA